MPCPRCQREPPAGAEFCPECGAKLAATCPQCGTLNDHDHRFCTKCGRPLRSVSVERGERGRAGPSRSHIPPHLAEKILSSRSALEGERKQVTVLFADLQGSMELIADRDPEVARQILDPVVELMMEAIHRYEGTVNQVLGDGIMALFGAPLAHEDDAVRACYAALRMQAELKRYAEQVRRSQGVNVRIRVGLNSGEVVVRAIGNDLHMDYTAIGQTTHLAARMEQLADPGSILLTPATFALVEGYVQVKAHGPIAVKGLSEPINVYELLGGGLARTRFQAATARGLVPFVGREAEIEQLRRAMTRAAEGHGQVVAVVGEAGVGKSRLFYEFTHSQRLDEWLLLESGSVSYGRATAYLPISDLLRAYFKIDDRDDAREIRAKVVGRMAGVEGGLEALLPPILALLDAPVEDAGWTALDAAQRRRRTIDVVKRLLIRESQVQPLLLVLEDLHWIDSETQAVLDSLVDSLSSARVLALVNYRPGYEHRWGNKTYYTQIRLENLSPDRTSDLLRALLGDAPRLEPLKQMLLKRGNPLFLEEIVRALVERRALEGHPGAYQLMRPVESLHIPSTVQTMLAARIDTLPEEEKHLLQAASVIGKDVPYAILAGTTDLPEEALRRALSHLQEAEFLYETSLFPELQYTFKHALTHDVAYASLVGDRKRALHAVIVGVMERLYADRLDERVGDLAHHAFRGELWDKAVSYLRRAGHRAVARSASREAIASFERALAALEHVPEDRRTLEAAVDIRSELQSALIPIGDLERMLTLLGEAEAAAEKLDDRRRLGQVTAAMSHCLWWTGEPDRSAEVGERALAIASNLQDLGLRIVSSLRLIQASFAMADYPRAIEVGRSSLDLLTGAGRHEAFGQPALPSVTIRAFVGKSQAALGDFDVGFAKVEEAIAIAQQLGHPYTLIIAYWGAGDAYVIRGDLIKAIGVLERGLELCRRGDFVLMAPIVTRILGEAYALAGRHADAVGYEQRAAEQLESLRYIPALPTAYAGLGEAQFLAGRAADALRSARVAVDLSRRHGQRGTLAGALRILGDILTEGEAPDAQAGAAYEEALALAETHGMRPLVARCRLGLGRLHLKARRPAEARAHLEAAASQCAAMGMTLWAEQADAALLAVRSGFD
jgi:class 3 adenylate cyclase/tetratricopeptide (TPR) repeat protein